MKYVLVILFIVQYTLKRLEKQAEVIVRVRVNKDERREFNMNLTITNVEVMEVYKGDVEEENIYVIEPIFFLSFIIG